MQRLIPVELDTRFAAMHVDALILAICGIIVTLVQTRTFSDINVEQPLLVIGAFFLYVWLSNRLFGATIGQKLLGYKIIAVEGQNPNYLLRTLCGGIALALFGITWWWNHHVKDGHYWWDRVSNTRALRTT